MSKTKSFSISKKSVMASWERAKGNKGSGGIDEESIEDFESNLKNNLYKIWNRMSSGTYFPPPVMAVEIPKAGGKTRLLGVPTISDRVAQGVAKHFLEPIVEPKFHEDSYGYRPKKSALDAVGIARKRCWQYSWCIDLDIKAFFDTLSHELVMKAVRFHTDEKWIHLYVERWLKAPIQDRNGKLTERKLGVSQGGSISPLVSNIFMHHVFDDWMKRHFSTVSFERYVDDIVVHCSTLKQAEMILGKIRNRLKECGLALNLEKTKIVYCKKDRRNLVYEHTSFDFLGYTFRPRLSKTKCGEYFVSFTPAISNKAAKRIRQEIRSWRLHRQTNKNIEDLAKVYNAKVRGWFNYYGRFNKSSIYPTLRNIERYLIRWVMKKYKRYKGTKRRAKHWLGRVRKREPIMFTHWKLGLGSPTG